MQNYVYHVQLLMVFADTCFGFCRNDLWRDAGGIVTWAGSVKNGVTGRQREEGDCTVDSFVIFLNFEPKYNLF